MGAKNCKVCDRGSTYKDWSTCERCHQAVWDTATLRAFSQETAANLAQKLIGYQYSETGAERGGVLAACEFIHRDSVVPLKLDLEAFAEESSVYFECHAYLRRKLEKWQEPSSEYDAAVKALIVVALKSRPWTWRQHEDPEQLRRETDAKIRRDTKHLL